MCGFVGFYLNSGEDAPVEMEKIIANMTDKLEHRGPDDRGTWLDHKHSIALGHRRLAIVDVSSSGHQPMASASSRYVIALNGEVYNHSELRSELDLINPNSQWSGHSDTETLLAGIEAWGIEKTLSKAVGMFAIALWDRKNHTLNLIRDRFGEKPLYYGWINTGSAKVFAFGSELKALRAYPSFQNAISRDALKQFFKYMYVPAPYSIFECIYKLEPGCILSMKKPPKTEPTNVPHPQEDQDVFYDGLQISKWYKFKEAISKNAKEFIKDEAEATELLEKQLKETIKIQSLADVPLGAFLSGGVDSSAVVALMQDQASSPIKTFTIGFEESQFDESPYAKAVASHLKTEHHEMRVTSNDALSLIPQLPHLYDEPFADASQIPTYFVSQAAKKEVTVSLSGDAGDELFGGYNRYLMAPELWKKIHWMPFSARKLLGSSFSKIPMGLWDKIGDLYNSTRSDSRGIARLGDKISKTALRLKNVDSLDALYKNLVFEWPDTDALVKGDSSSSSTLINLIEESLPAGGFDNSESRMMYWDTISYLPDDILCKVDRAAMANSLETRVPFLDHRVVELAQRIPLQFKIKDSIGKSVLRDILYKHVPKDLIERPKVGFGIPLAEWLRGPLRPWVEELINSERLDREGYLQSELVHQVWREHLSGKRDWSSRIWAVVIFQQWLEAS
ncbi:asparagine synthase (glutamine-hydrolyzing) [Gammaproteobacteria bacterium]|nr:asparagine synthase (glutamine-hydrolyzing) [Gammaproteobacteria bacterium]